MRKAITYLLNVLIFSVGNLFAGNGNKPLYNDKDINRIVSQLTLEQKARLLVGCPGSDKGVSHIVAGSAGYTFPLDSLGIPSINLADGPVGVRITPVLSNKPYTSYCTCFPSTTALAATWNKEMARMEGNAIGDEALAYGVDIVLTPGINIMRNPLCGRNFEYFSEDPYLSGIMGAAMINGIQDKGIGTSLKHFIANNQQTGKLYNDARISQRAVREIYLKGFEICIKNSDPWTIMGSYNKIGGQYTQANPELLRTILRNEWNYNGLVVTDWYKKRDTADQLNGGTNLMMPGEQSQVDEIIAGVKSGRISEATLNESVKHVLKLISKSISCKGWKYNEAPDLAANAALARRIATEGMVLLKNDSSFLPIPQNTKIALFGATAYKSIAGGTGSSNVNKAHITDISAGLEKAGYTLSDRLKGLYTKFVEFQNDLLDKHPESTDWERLSYNRTVIAEMDLSKAESIIGQEAKNSDIALIVIGRGSGEESDRRLKGDFYLTPEEKFMIENVSSQFHAAGKKVAVVMNVCGVMEMNSWKDEPDAILLAWFPGQECGDAIADVVSGKANPSGKLPMTFPIDYSDIPSSRNFPMVGETKSGKNFDYTNYEEDIWVGYRYFNTANKAIVYPFGYGLSYTDFSFSKPKLERKGGKWVTSIQITNIGDRSGKETVQLYISAPQTSIQKPSVELKAFGKTRELKPGESETVKLELTDYDLASFDEANSQWLTAKGEYVLSFGASSKDFRATLPLNIHKDRTWKVNNVLRPVEKVNIMKTDSLTYFDAARFTVIGKIYPDSLPLFSRIPYFLKPTTRKAVWNLGQNSAGIAVRFRSDSPVIAVKWENAFNNSMKHMAPVGIKGLDLYCFTDGTWQFVNSAQPSGKTNQWQIISGMSATEREYMLYLPLYDGIHSLQIGVTASSHIGQPALPYPDTRKPIVFYGSSILQGACASRPGMAATNRIGRKLNIETINLGFSGNAFIDYEVAEMMSHVDASAYILDYVPNASPEQILEKTEKFVRILREKHPDVPLIFVEDPIFPHSKFDFKMAQEIKDKNDAMNRAFSSLKELGLKKIYLVKGESLVSVDGESTVDGIHFTDYGFEQYTNAILPVLKKVITNKKK